MEAAAKSETDFYYNNVVYEILIKLELIEEDVAASLRIEAEATYMNFLQKVNKTVNLLFQIEMRGTQQAIT